MSGSPSLSPLSLPSTAHGGGGGSADSMRVTSPPPDERASDPREEEAFAAMEATADAISARLMAQERLRTQLTSRAEKAEGMLREERDEVTVARAAAAQAVRRAARAEAKAAEAQAHAALADRVATNLALECNGLREHIKRISAAAETQIAELKASLEDARRNLALYKLTVAHLTAAKDAERRALGHGPTKADVLGWKKDFESSRETLFGASDDYLSMNGSIPGSAASTPRAPRSAAASAAAAAAGAASPPRRAAPTGPSLPKHLSAGHTPRGAAPTTPRRGR